MWRNIAKQALSKSKGLCLNACSSPFGQSHVSILSGKCKVRIFEPISGLKFEFLEMGYGNFGCLRNQIGFGEFLAKGYASVAEAVTSTDVEDDSHDEVEDLMKEMKKEERKKYVIRWQNMKNRARGMSQSEYRLLRRRQVKIETEAWEQAAKEYRELLMDMCEQKLAPNLPYIKSLFLGWFEPFRDAIAKEQELCQRKTKAGHAPFIDQLPADMMAVITMHKLVSLLMTAPEHNAVKVVHAAITVGEAIEHEVCLHFAHLARV